MGQWKKLKSKYLLENPWYKVRQDTVLRPDGAEGTFNVVECGKSVFIVPVTRDSKVLLVKLFRYPTQSEGWEVPAGGVEADETPLAAARRELQEETGQKSNDWIDLGSFESMNGITDSVGHIFEAKNLIETTYNEQAEEGISEVRAFSLHEIVEMIQSGQIVDALSIAALMHFCIKHGLLDDRN